MKEIAFFDEVHDFQRFVRENINLIGNLTILSEQLYMKTNETSIIDILALDNNNKRIVILELKNDVTTDKNVWQPIRYYDLLRRGEDSIKELLFNASDRIKIDVNDINIIPMIKLIVPSCNEQLLRTLSYFNEIDIEVVELKRYEKNNNIEIVKKVYYPTSIFHEEDLTQIQNKISKTWNFEEYLNSGINKHKINIAQVLSRDIKLLFDKEEIKYDIFFSETKMTITKNNKVWFNLFIKQNPLNHNLDISIKLKKDHTIDKNKFLYNHCVESVDIKNTSIKLKVNRADIIDLIELCI